MSRETLRKWPAANRARAVDHRDGHQPGNAEPVFPTMEAREVVRAHDPHEMHGGQPAPKPSQRVEAVAGADRGFEPGYVDSRMRGQLLRGRAPIRERRQRAGVLE